MIKLTTSTAVLVLLAAACGGEEPPPVAPAPPPATVAPPPPPAATVEAPPPPKPTMAELQKKTLLAQKDAFNAHDAKAVAATFSTDAQMRMPSMDGFKDSTGRDAIQKDHEQLFGMDPTVAMGYSRVFQKNDVAVAEWVGTGTGKDGKKVGFKAASVYWFDADGNVKKEHDYFDYGTIGMQMGMMPGKAREVQALPSGEPTWVVSKGDASEDKNVDTSKNTWPASWSKHDKKAYEASLSDDTVHENLSAPTDAKGKAEALKEYDMYIKAFPDLAFTVDQGWGVGNVAIFEWTSKGTQKGALGPLKASNKAVTTHGLEIDEIKGDKLGSKGTSYSNGAELMTQVGAMPKAPPSGAKPGDKTTATASGAKPSDKSAPPAGAKPAPLPPPAAKKP